MVTFHEDLRIDLLFSKNNGVSYRYTNFNSSFGDKFFGSSIPMYAHKLLKI